MKLNKKGITLIEIIVSLALISVVLIFLIRLFTSVRGTYNTSKNEADYEMQNSIITRAIGNDIEKYGLYCVSTVTKKGSEESVLIVYDAYRPTKLDDRIKKVLKVYTHPTTKQKIISYAYDDAYSSDINSAERITKMTSEIPNSAILRSPYIIVNHSTINTSGVTNGIAKIKIPLYNEVGTNYSINIWGITRMTTADCSRLAI